MKPRQVLIVLAVASLIAQTGAVAHGQWFPERTRHYRFLPGRSVIEVTGGFAGVEERQHVAGTFDLVTSVSPIAIWPPIYTARFEAVDASFRFSLSGEPVDIDVALNLSEAQGATEYREPSNIFYFDSENLDGSAVKLVGITLGPWLYLRGGTTQPVGGADFFEYRFRGLARTRPFADFNDDGVVDGRDLAAWRNDPQRGGSDFLDWQQQLGETPPSEANLELALEAALAAAGAHAAAVPEPAAAMLLVTGAAIVALRRRGRVEA